MPGYRGRFAPSPTGPLHAGSLVAALASWLDARAHAGAWLVRIEDIDTPRCVAGADQEILRQLAAVGLLPDAPPVWQSHRTGLYAQALERLKGDGEAYPCTCSRQQIERTWAARGLPRLRHGERIYPGTCRPPRGAPGSRPRGERAAWRVRTDRPDGTPVEIEWVDRRLGMLRQDLTHDVGDFVVRRSDGLWAYQLAVVVDDAAQGITDVVRGEDLADNTPRQIHLQRLLGLPSPRHLHTPLVLDARGEKLSKSDGATALDTRAPLANLAAAAATLGLQVPDTSGLGDWLAAAVHAWSAQTDRKCSR